jgi:hypothetical protein
MPRSKEDKVEIIFLYGECGHFYFATAKRFNELFPDDHPIDHKYVSYLVTKFRETESVKDQPRSSRSKVDENIVIEIISRITENSQQSLAELHNASNILHSTS